MKRIIYGELKDIEVKIIKQFFPGFDEKLFCDIFRKNVPIADETLYGPFLEKKFEAFE